MKQSFRHFFFAKSALTVAKSQTVSENVTLVDGFIS